MVKSGASGSIATAFTRVILNHERMYTWIFGLISKHHAESLKSFSSKILIYTLIVFPMAWPAISRVVLLDFFDPWQTTVIL
jgi:hypothetical protein